MGWSDLSQSFYKRLGRTYLTESGSLELISAAAQIAFVTSGRSAQLSMHMKDAERGYVTVSVNNEEVEKYAITKDAIQIVLNLPEQTSSIRVVKDTEAITGTLVVDSIASYGFLPAPKPERLFIEFIGNSITSAMGADTMDIACEEGRWYDQHRASRSYASLLSDSLKADFVLNSVSGIGIYRNWNDENIKEPIMPQVYDNLYLNRDTLQRYMPDRHPDLISICLGTNDLSKGDGVKDRLPFNQEKYLTSYISFVKKLLQRSPEAKVVLLTSPMVKGEEAKVLLESLKEVKEHFEHTGRIFLFEFDQVIPTGCTYHPLIPEHVEMANQVFPFFRKLLNQ